MNKTEDRWKSVSERSFATTRKECNEPEEFWWLAEVLQTVFLPISINVWMYNIDNEKLKFCKCIYNANAIDYW